ncbi:ABC transporter substrate-binding protein [Hahella sp. SMD15-11]|uniref:ABC transporter substrate-binding protein n=1 Tax=Thermohahella caldifontis TaxID=3142973 RepID=A0AB39UTM5_9GAMM
MRNGLIFLGTLLLLCMGQARQVLADEVRWITLGAAITETVFALGAGDKVVATDTTSHAPDAVHALPRVGYLRALSPEGILSVRPTGILADDQAGPAHTRRIIEQAGLPWHSVRSPVTASDTLAMIVQLGQLLGRQKEADQLAADVARKLEAAARTPSGQRGILLLHVHGRQLLAGGRRTQAASLLALAGLENGVTFEGYKPVSTEALLSAQPDWLVVAWARAPLDLSSFPELRGLEAVRQGRVIQAEASRLLSFGPGLPDAVTTLTQAMAPHVADAK